jgi:hypothetical protein
MSMSRAPWNSSLIAGISSQCSMGKPGGAIAARSQPNETTRQVLLFARHPPGTVTSYIDAILRGPLATVDGTPRTGSMPADVA